MATAKKSDSEGTSENPDSTAPNIENSDPTGSSVEPEANAQETVITPSDVAAVTPSAPVMPVARYNQETGATEV